MEAFADRDAPRYLIRDRDSVYGTDVRLRMIIGIVLFTTHLCAFADPCPAGTVAQLLTQVQSTGPCTIGDLSFDFTSYTSLPDVGAVNGKVGPDHMNFVPITGTKPGFDLLSTELSGFDDATADCSVVCSTDIFLDFSVSGGLVGMNATLQEPSFVLDPILDTFCCANPVPTFASGVASANLHFGNLLASVTTENSQIFGQEAVLTTTFSNDPATFLPVSSLTGGAEVSVIAKARNARPGARGSVYDTEQPRHDILLRRPI